jgi:intracellular sulfur oxidation DsrE/DsrF family protein
MNDPVSPELLDAFIDGELAADERERVLAQLASDPDFKARACETRALKEQVRAAYADFPALAKRRHASRMSRAWPMALAAGLVLAIGLGGGWMARDVIPDTPRIDRLAGLPSGYQPISLSARIDPDKVLLHLDSSEPDRIGTTLDLAEKMLGERKGRGQLAIVVNTYGLNLLRQDTSLDRARIQRLARQHPNLSFIACGQTIARLKRDGVEVVLLPEASVASSAISEILGRMQKGWVYVKV